MERLTIKYLNPALLNTSYYYPDEVKKIAPAASDRFTIIFTGWDWDAINSLRSTFPNLAFQEHTNGFGDTFLTLQN